VPVFKSPGLGQRLEQLAAHYLQNQGLVLLEKNYRCRFGEIDLILQDGATLVFAEVRYRRNDRFGGAKASITTAKQRRIMLAAQHYLSKRSLKACRFDAVLLNGTQTSEIEWIRNAFEI
jgi:putative endonuclease